MDVARVSSSSDPTQALMMSLDKTLSVPLAGMPIHLPPSSIDIRIRSSVQTDEVWAVFSWDDTTRGRLNECVPSPLTTLTFPRKLSDWWPDDLRSEKSVTQRLEL